MSRDLYVEGRIAFGDQPDVRLCTRDLADGRQQLRMRTVLRGRELVGTLDVDLTRVKDRDVTLAAEEARYAYGVAARNAPANVTDDDLPVTFANDFPPRPPSWKEHATSGGFSPYRLGQR